MKKTLIIDNYDSFTYNLFQLVAEIGGNPVVFQNNRITLADIEKIHPTHIILSPGPGTVERKEDFGICGELLGAMLQNPEKNRPHQRSEKQPPKYKIPTFGVCLGHQGIIHALGGKIVRAPTIMHGKQSLIEHDHSTLFQNVPNPFQAMRYHSLCGSSENFPPALKITARSKDDDTIMGIQHSTLPIFGVQFHPESFGTPDGKQILKNFLDA